MKIFYTETTDPTYNLALEEYLFKNTKDNWFFLWQNDNAVIIGKNQVALKEVDSRIANENGTKIVRRMTGGGAVYHDMGNINYSYIVNSEDTGICFERYTKAVIDYLATLGVTAEFGGRNDILVDGKKVSGNAQHIASGRVLHHGTMLFNANLQYAGSVLTPESVKMQGKGVASVKSRITNISEYLKEPMTTPEFIQGLLDYVAQSASADIQNPSEEHHEGALALQAERYATFGWNLGASPRYDLLETRRFDFGTVTVTMDIAEGMIADIAITGDFFGAGDIEQFCERLKNTPHSREEVLDISTDISEFISGMTTEEFVTLLF